MRSPTPGFRSLLLSLLPLLCLLPGCRSQPDNRTTTRLTFLLDTMAVEKGQVLLNAQWHLIQLGEVAVPSLLTALESKNEQLRGSAAFCLGEMDDTRALPPLKKLLSDEALVVRYEAAGSLIKLGDREGIPVLIAALRDQRSWCRLNAFTNLKEATGQEFGFSPDGPPEAREKSVTQWESWWNEQGRTCELKTR